MANSAGDARGSEQTIRQKLVEAGVVDVIVAVGPNMFYTVTLPCTLWFIDRAKSDGPRSDKVLFLDARNMYRQLDRAHRDWTPQHVEFLSNIVRLYRGIDPEIANGNDLLLQQHGLSNQYVDILGLCKVSTLSEIENQSWSLNPGRYVGSVQGAEEDVDFQKRIEELAEELAVLTTEAHELEDAIAENVTKVLETSL